MIIIPRIVTSFVVFSFLSILMPLMVAAEPACGPEELSQCNKLASLYRTGTDPFPKDYDRSKELLRGVVEGRWQNCRNGYGESCFGVLSDLRMLSSMGDPVDWSSAYDEYRQITKAQCDAGEAMGCYWLASLFIDLDYMEYEIIQAAKSDKALGQNELSENALKAQRLQEEAEAKAEVQVTALRQQCDKDDQNACYKLGSLIREFDLPESSPNGSLELIFGSCMAGNDRACSGLEYALSYIFGKPENPSAEFSLFQQKASAQCVDGNRMGCRVLAEMSGKDEKYKYYAQACDLADGISCQELAIFNLEEAKQAKDDSLLERSRELFDKACNLKFRISCHYLEHLSSSQAGKN